MLGEGQGGSKRTAYQCLGFQRRPYLRLTRLPKSAVRDLTQTPSQACYLQTSVQTYGSGGLAGLALSVEDLTTHIRFDAPCTNIMQSDTEATNPNV